MEVNLPFLLCFTIFQVQAPGGGGAFIWRGDLMEGVLRVWEAYILEGLIFRILRYLIKNTLYCSLLNLFGFDKLRLKLL